MRDRIVGSVVVQLDSHVLLVQRAVEPSYGRWALPGGFAEAGETAAQAALREVMEEVGIAVEVGAEVGVYEAGDGTTIHVFAADVISGEPAARDETLAIGLFAADDIPWDELAFPTTTLALRDFVRRAI